MIAALLKPILARASDDTLRKLVELGFSRSRRALAGAVADPRGAQEARLRTILQQNADTEIGRRLGFASIKNLDDYRRAVPPSTWDDIEPLVERMVAGERGLLVAEDVYFFATTSGTTGRRKLIPVTSAFVDECKVTNRLLFRATLLAMPGLVRGKRLSLRSPKTEALGPGRVAGSITAALGAGLEEEEGAFDAVPVDVFFVADFAARYRLALRLALQEDVRVCSAVNPSTLLLFAQTLAEHGAALADDCERGDAGADLTTLLPPERAARLQLRVHKAPEAAARLRASIAAHGHARMRDVFPNLCGLVCWQGGTAPWYTAQLPASYGDVPILDYGYCASEGCFGAALDENSPNSVLVPHAHVVELIPEARLADVQAGRAHTLLLDEAQVGQRYYVVVTTGAGLYRYQMNDVVECTGHLDRAPLVVFRHKGGAIASVTGEKVTEAHVVQAMAAACVDDTDAIAGFVAAPLLPPSQTPHYLLAVDSALSLSDERLAALAARFDVALRAQNEEVDAKRGSLRLGPVRAVQLPRGAFVVHRAARVAGGAPDAHVKTPHISPDGALLLALGLEQVAPALSSMLPCRVSP